MTQNCSIVDKIGSSLLFLLALLSVISVFQSQKTLAHQSGCHRWHSCPSDSGSYTCGDTGYSNYCGSTNNTAPAPPDYRQLGVSKGREDAGTKAIGTADLAKVEGRGQGRSDGSSGAANLPLPNAKPVCDIEFTFNGYTTSEYRSGYHDGYLESCSTSYRDAYIASYQAGYLVGQQEYNEKQAEVQRAATAKSTGAEKPEATNTKAAPILWGVVALVMLGTLSYGIFGSKKVE